MVPFVDIGVIVAIVVAVSVAVAVAVAKVDETSSTDPEEDVAISAVPGYNSGNKLLTSSGSLTYHSGFISPVGMGVLGSLGMAVLSTERRESWVGFMVVGSMARFWR
jgi:hypothetical protein